MAGCEKIFPISHSNISPAARKAPHLQPSSATINRATPRLSEPAPIDLRNPRSKNLHFRANSSATVETLRLIHIVPVLGTLAHRRKASPHSWTAKLPCCPSESLVAAAISRGLKQSPLSLFAFATFAPDLATPAAPTPGIPPRRLAAATKFRCYQRHPPLPVIWLQSLSV